MQIVVAAVEFEQNDSELKKEKRKKKNKQVWIKITCDEKLLKRKKRCPEIYDVHVWYSVFSGNGGIIGKRMELNYKQGMS